MNTIRVLCARFSRTRFSRERNKSQRRMLMVHDPDLVAMVRIADQRRHGKNDDLERVLEKFRPILNRSSQALVVLPRLELPTQQKAHVAAIPDADESRIDLHQTRAHTAV